MRVDLQRKDRLRAALTRAGLDAVICTSASEVLLLTGYWPIMSTSVAVFTAEGEVHVIVPDDEQELAASTSAATLTPYKPELLDQLTGPIAQLHDPLGRLTTSLGLQHAKIGITEQLGTQPAAYAVSTLFRQSLDELLKQLLPEATFTACDDLLEREKAVKTLQELQLMQTAANVAAAGFAAAAKAIRPGLREAEVAAVLQAAFDASPGAEALQRSYGFFFCMSGPNSATAAAAFARTRQRRIEPGDLVMIHANTCADGLWTDITRTYTAGDANVERHEQMRAAITEARAAALQAIRPGVPTREVDKAARDVMQAHGFGDKLFKHATGHGVGFAAANANALPRIHPQAPDVLAEAMTFNIEPAAYFEGYGGMRHCDVVAVTADGVEVLTDY